MIRGPDVQTKKTIRKELLYVSEFFFVYLKPLKIISIKVKCLQWEATLLRLLMNISILVLFFNTRLNDAVGTMPDYLIGQPRKATYQARKLSNAAVGQLSPKTCIQGL